MQELPNLWGGRRPFEPGAGFTFWLWLLANPICACGLVRLEEGKGRGQELIVTHIHRSKFQELIPIMISHFGSICVHLNHITFILSYVFEFLASENV